MRSTTTTETRGGRNRLLSVGLAALGCALAIAACGSSSPTGSSSSTGRASSGSTLAFSRCMRADGVPNFPDINGDGMRFQSTQGPSGQTMSVNGVSVNAPAFLAARHKCQRYMPHQVLSQSQTSQALQRTLEFARCMRSHGIKSFPDPKITTGPGGGPGVDLRGARLNFQSPAFQAAAKACGGGPKGP